MSVGFQSTYAPAWGGARNRADRVSWQLTGRQLRDAVAATKHAWAIGLPFNRHWTIHTERAGISAEEGAAFVGRLLDTVRRYAKRKGYQMTALWVREDGEGKGGHVHILIHLPPTLSLRTLTVRWIKTAGGTYRSGVSYVVSIGGGLNCAETNPEHYSVNLGEVLSYVLKAADPEAAQDIGLPRHGVGGLVVGKRIGWTQNIGVAARGSGLPM